ncbi:GAF domain-containing protein [Burkholderia ambifaria]|uniref:GAF domain-containing protein n=1 Tax=Burkholderia ambifaria TaxID=152480 RepID=UPI002FE1C1A8
MAHALLANDPMMIPGARKDDRFHDNPFVTGQPGIRFYAGGPLATPNGLPASPRDRASAAPAHSPGTAAANSRAVERRRSGRRRRADLAHVTPALAQHNAAYARGYAIRFSVGRAAYEPARHHTVAALLA